jgi:hypothetical protein
MDFAIKTTPGPATGVASAIAQAAHATGERFDFLLASARLESGLNPTARARTSSAAGLFQFIDRTWLATIKRHGAKHGLSWAAQAIDWAGGQLRVADAEVRAAILRLRDDPVAAAAMAAEHAAENRQRLEARLGRPVADADLYLAHFLGAGGAARFLKAMDAAPDAAAASVNPRAARANRSVFFARDGRPRSLAEVHERFAARLAKAGADGARVKGATPVLAARQTAQSAVDALGPQPAAMPAPAARAAQAAYLLLARIGA